VFRITSDDVAAMFDAYGRSGATYASFESRDLRGVRLNLPPSVASVERAVDAVAKFLQ
jgi:hypothetical protein